MEVYVATVLFVLAFVAMVAFAIEHRITYGWASGSASLSYTETLSGDGEDNREVSAGALATTEVLIPIDISALKSFYLYSDVALTLKTNDSGTPDDTIAVAAGKPIVWTNNSVLANPFTVDVTKFYFVNATAGAATVKIKVLQDVTP